MTKATDRPAKRKPLLILDPGHGSGPRAQWQGRKGYDPGAVDTRRDITEAEANVAAALTLKHLLEERGVRVVLTHDGTQGAKTDLLKRVRMVSELGADGLISLHYDMMFTPPRHLSGIYYAPGTASFTFAKALLTSLYQGRDSWLKRSSDSRFNGLYIDGVADNKPSILIELDSIGHAPEPGPAGRTARLLSLAPLAARIATELHARV